MWLPVLEGKLSNCTRKVCPVRTSILKGNCTINSRDGREGLNSTAFNVRGGRSERDIWSCVLTAAPSLFRSRAESTRDTIAVEHSAQHRDGLVRVNSEGVSGQRSWAGM